MSSASAEKQQLLQSDVAGGLSTVMYVAIAATTVACTMLALFQDASATQLQVAAATPTISLPRVSQLQGGQAGRASSSLRSQAGPVEVGFGTETALEGPRPVLSQELQAVGDALLKCGMLLAGVSIGWLLEHWRSSKRVAAPLTDIAIATATSERKETAAESSKGQPMRTRFAPSPTGSLHVGGARTALYNWLMAKKTGGTFILRIEDTDMARSTRASEESMKADLRWLGLKWDEGPETAKEAEFPFRQSERGSIYADMAKKLMEKVGADGKSVAYPCFSKQEEVDALKSATEATGEFQGNFVSPWRDASPEEVQAKIAAGEPYAIRFRVPKGKRVAIDDIVRGPVSWDAEATIGDFVLLRSSGVPVYNFCVAVDDALMGITHVIRAEEHLTNTLRQGLILEALGFPMPRYAHCSLILGEDGSKLSKRHGATSVAQFADEGFVPSAMINYLVGLGWNDGTDKEVYTIDEVIAAFDVNRVQKSPSVFDMKKLRWINGQHLHNMEDADLAVLLGPFLVKAGLCKAEDSPLALVAAHMCKQKIELLVDTVPLVQAALTHDLTATLANDESAAKLLGEDLKGLAKALVEAYEAGEFPDASQADFTDKYGAWVKEFGKKIGRKGKQLMQPLRLLLTGSMSGPDVGCQLRIAALAEQEGVSSVPVAARMAAIKTFASS